MKRLFVVFSLLIVAVVAQQQPISCRYFLFEFVSETLYTCELTINNPNGLNNFTAIGGAHLPGYTNSNVELIYRVGGVTTNIPNVLCATFPNLLRMELYELGLTTITDISFNGCSRVNEINLTGNRITSISANAFASLPGLLSIVLEEFTYNAA